MMGVKSLSVGVIIMLCMMGSVGGTPSVSVRSTNDDMDTKVYCRMSTTGVSRCVDKPFESTGNSHWCPVRLCGPSYVPAHLCAQDYPADSKCAVRYMAGGGRHGGGVWKCKEPAAYKTFPLHRGCIGTHCEEVKTCLCYLDQRLQRKLVFLSSISVECS